MGDAAGIGPEIIVKVFNHQDIYAHCRPIVIGDGKILNIAREIVKSKNDIHSISDISEALFQYGVIDCLDLDLLSPNIALGKLSSAAGDAAYYFIEKAITLAKKGEINAICTAPINKEAMNMAGHHYPGHTEILAKLTGTEDFRMMFYSPTLKVILVTIHIGIIDAINIIDHDLVLKTIYLAYNALLEDGISSPRLGICGINPHAGEGGLFGYREEEEKIIPAVEDAKKAGINAVGPLPADTIFFRARRGDFDIVVAMYHDQGLIPIKTLGLELGINITLGLPIIRTSVDHGTAFDIAGLGVADETNLKAAILKAADLASKKKIK